MMSDKTRISPMVLAEFRHSDVIDIALGVAVPGNRDTPSLLGGAPRPLPAEEPIDVRLVNGPRWPESGLELADRRSRLVPVR
jgi:hypothetical protein